MTFERAFALSSVLLAAVACSGLLFAQSLPLWLALPTALILILSLLQAGGAPVVRRAMAQATIAPALSNVLSLGAFAVFLADLILFSRDLLPAGIHFLVLLLNSNYSPFNNAAIIGISTPSASWPSWRLLQSRPTPGMCRSFCCICSQRSGPSCSIT